MIKKRDIILALGLILLGIVCYGVIRLGQKKGSQVMKTRKRLADMI